MKRMVFLTDLQKRKAATAAKKTVHVFTCLIICAGLLVGAIPQAYANEGTYTFETYPNGFGWTYTYTEDWTETYYFDDSDSGKGSKSAGGVYQYEKATDIDKVIEICQKYSDRNTVTGVRNQIDWMKQLNFAVSRDFVAQLGMGDVLLLSVLNHSDINTMFLTSDYSIGDINREVAKKSQRVLKGMFMETVRRYTDATTITKRMVAELIDHIDVYHAEKCDGVTNQRVTIYYNCIGAFDVPDRRKIPEADIIMETRKGVAISYAPAHTVV